MRATTIPAGLALVWTATLLLRVQAAPALPPQAGRIDFERQVKPILEARCLECHNQEKRKGGLSLATYGDALEGGRSGAAIRPGTSGGSLLVHRVAGEIEPQMPKDEDPLSSAEIALVRRWIDEGARATPSSPPAPPPWEAPMALDRPALPPAAWPAWSAPIDRFTAAYLRGRSQAEPRTVSDAVFARRVHLDIWGLLPTPEALDAFLKDPAPDRRERLVARLLADDRKYAEHWISFWNDLLRNEDGVTYYSESASRKSITEWLFAALESNMPYDRFVSALLNPVAPGDPEGFLVGVNWRGETSAAVTPWMQASQNSAQIFLGVNLKCNSCHDSFINKWKLKDAYALAGFFSPEPRLQLNRCDVPLEQFAEPAFLYPDLNRTAPSSSLADRRATAAAIFTDPKNGRMPRTAVNRLWARLLGHGIVPNPDEMDGVPWSPQLLDWLASDFVEHGYDLKRTIGVIVSSRAYQMASVARDREPPSRDYVFAGPEVRRMTAEQFADAIGSITGEWSVYQPSSRPATPPAAAPSPPPATLSDPVSAGVYGREWHAPSTNLTRALGRPIRDQVISSRAAQATTPQALELVNGEILTRWLAAGARRMLGELPPEPASLYNKAVGGRTAPARPFDIDVSKASRLWLIVTDTGSNAPERIEPIWLSAELVGPSGATPLSALTAVDGSGARAAGTSNPPANSVRVKNPSRLVYDIAGKGFERFRGRVGLENPVNEIGATLNPAVRFFVFDAEPNMQRLVPPAAMPSAPAVPARTSSELVERVFRHALGRAPSAGERQAATAAVSRADAPGRPSADGLADLLWALMMKPEFQLIY